MCVKCLVKPMDLNDFKRFPRKCYIFNNCRKLLFIAVADTTCIFSMVTLMGSLMILKCASYVQVPMIPHRCVMCYISSGC